MRNPIIMSRIARTLSYISVFTIGLYASSQFKFSQEIEPYRWAMTFLCFVFFLGMEKSYKR